MALAQQLYEGLTVGGSQVGLITYMRTDSTNIADERARRDAGLHRRQVRRRARAAGAARLPQEGEGRAGGARGDPADVGASRARRR